MEQLAKFFPVNKRVKKGNIGSLVITIIIYIVLPVVLGLVTGLIDLILGGIPVIGALITWVLGVISSLIGLYCLIGIILAVVDFVK